MATSTTLSGKTALLTGAARGIGGACARRIAQMGATVLINYLTSESTANALVDTIRSAGAKSHALQGDVSDEKQLDAMFATIDKSHGGRVDILVNNAGAFLVKNFTEMTLAEFDRVMNVNVRATVMTTMQALKRMPDGGRIINIGSILGQWAAFEGVSAYAASKFAMVGLTRAWARDLASRRITSNIIQPGVIDTPMSPDDPSNPKAEYLRSVVPLGRFGTSDELASAVAFLASPAASWVNGAVLNVDGGWTS